MTFYKENIQVDIVQVNFVSLWQANSMATEPGISSYRVKLKNEGLVFHYLFTILKLQWRFLMLNMIEGKCMSKANLP